MTEVLSGPAPLIAVVLLVSATLQTSTGFGFALLSAPILAALTGPREAVSTIMLVGVVVDVLVLIADGRRPQPRPRDVVALTAWSMPGFVLGAVLLRLLPASALQLLVAVAVLATVAFRARPAHRRRARAERREHWWTPGPAGFASGVLSTATTVGGPPIVLYLTRRPRPPRETRDTLVALSVVRAPAGLAALILTGTWRTPPALPLLILGVVLGYMIGRWVFAHLDVGRYERVVLVTLVVAATVALVSAVA